MTLRQKLWLAEGLGITGCLLACMAVWMDASMAMCLIGCALMTVGCVLIILWKRCPECGSLLGRDHADYCPYCGKKIDYDAGPDKK